MDGMRSFRNRLVLAGVIAALMVGAAGDPSSAAPKRPKGHATKGVAALPVVPTAPLPPLSDPVITTKKAGKVQVGTEQQAAAAAAATELAATEVTASAISDVPCAKPVLDLRILLLSADGTEVTLPAIRQALDFIGTPYTLWIAAQRPGALVPDVLAGGSDGCHGFYQGIVLATGALSYSPDGGTTWASALSDAEWGTLAIYEANLKVRRVSWYTYPTAGYGFAPPSGAVDTTTTPLNTTYTTAGKSVFSYANTVNALPIKGAYMYLAKPLDANTTSLLADAQGNAIVAQTNYADGRQAIAVTAASNQYLTHGLVLSYGLVNWVTRGVFLGQRRSNLSAQIDDVMIEDDIWVGYPCETCASYRMSGADLDRAVAWQNQWQLATPQTANIRLDMAFNGEGSTAGAFAPDTLTPRIVAQENEFRWINHTFAHPNLDTLTYAEAKAELQQNHQVAQKIGLSTYRKMNLVTPEISGLTNPEFLRAAKDFGIRYVVTDTSRPGHDNPTPNTGRYNAIEPAIFMIPRHPVNLFYNVTTPSEWVSEYNYIYRTFWGRDLSFAEIVDKESDVILFYLLRWDIDPLMFHQSNLRAYDGTHSLLSDLLEAVFAKYNRLLGIPFNSFAMDAIGGRMTARMTFNASGVTGSFTPGDTLTLATQNAATIPVTGVRGPGLESYGGQTIANVALAAGGTTTLDIGAPTWPSGSTLTASAITQTTLTLNWSAATDNVGVTAYRVLRNGALIATLGGGVTTYNATGLVKNTTYTFRVQAVDAAGYITSGPSVSARTLP